MKTRDSSSHRGKKPLSLLNANVRRNAGRKLRVKTPRSSHADFSVSRRGRDVVAMLQKSNRDRVPSLVPIRYGRMLHSPLSFLRGAASIMAYDLARTPVSGIRVQAGGDAHLMNFGGFATPERHLIFDVNDFDETLPAPWEWDLKRLAASVTVAGRYLGFSKRKNSAATMAAAAGYRTHMALYAPMPALDLWYQRIDATKVAELHFNSARKKTGGAPGHLVTEHLFPKMTETVGRMRRIKEELPLIFRPRKGDRTISHVPRMLAQYRATLPADRRALLERFELVDVAMKVVGVGSVGTRCAVVLMMGGDDDSLFLQLKEARASVLEPYAGRSKQRNHGERVVQGQRLMQAASDLFLGWSSDPSLHVDFYVRQLRDCKTAANIDTMDFAHLADYAHHCGAALARAHAKAGDAAAISGYIGRADAMDLALARFAEDYADQTEHDYSLLKAAAKSGRIPVEDA
ncbi:MAG TPA: DUF2252 domain-containing protein [Steroidobacteraceae bacterium]|jgi:uncharacterized protein (DUF2252 family)